MGTGASVPSNSMEFHNFADNVVARTVEETVIKLSKTSNGTVEIMRQPSNSRTMPNKMSSLRSFALKHHSRQENTYIPQESFMAAAKGLAKRSFAGKAALTSSKSNSSSGLLDINFDIDATYDRNLNIDKVKKKPILKISLEDAVHVDDEDWIQVSDDEGVEEDDSKSGRKKLNLNNNNNNGDGTDNNNNNNESCVFSQSGTIFVDGFRDRGIRVDGIEASTARGSRLNMRDRLVILCRLGAGASSIVYKALDLRDMRIVALKMVSVYERSKRRQMVKELTTLFQFLKQKSVLAESFRSSNPEIDNTTIVTTVPESVGEKKRRTTTLLTEDHFVVDFYNAFSNVDEGGVALMIEYLDGGSLQDIVAAGGCDDEVALASIARQALTGLNFLHNCAQLHRDLKPANFLISSRGEVKVGDFGILKDMTIGEENNNGNEGDNLGISSPLHRTSTFVGTATYMSPERIDGRPYSYSSDVWAFGLSMMTVALGALPINTKGGYWSILQSIRDEKPPALPNDGRFSPEFQDFVGRCMRKAPEERETCAQLLKHPFLRAASLEDPTSEEEDPEPGKQELKQIITALYLHLQKVQSSSSLTRSAEEMADWNYFFGGLSSGQNPAIVLRNIFYGLPPQSSEEELSPLPFRVYPLSPDEKITAAKRLQFLAHQLHISNIDELIREIDINLEQLAFKGLEEQYISTPRATGTSSYKLK